MAVPDYIIGKVRYDKDGQYFWDESNNMIAELRGWGRIQNLPQFDKGRKQDEAGRFQDEVGEWIADAINQKLGR